ncbi:MAG TPA: aspartate carbamoyltransferase catalytic subunit [Firmicutes bacterium]|jgi:aspartate carbamoyltransferase catalytic subunit|nr:aspartate carbamoyltransferase catalytic subunit [Bacillota bacterium]
MGLRGKDVLGLEDMTVEEIELILQTAESMREIMTRMIKKVPTLRGKSIVNLFYEPSTRTRSSFELASKYMSADSVNIATSTSSVQKGESLLDTARTLQAMGIDLVVIRHQSSGVPHFLARHLDASVINAGDGMHEHPTQALLDMFTIKQHKGDLRGLRVAIIGDILHSRVARSNIWGLTKMGAQVAVAGPATLLPPEMADLGVACYDRVEDAVAGADVVNVLRLQLERQRKGLFPTTREYAHYWGVNRRVLSLAKPDHILLHPGPMNRGVEISTDVADGNGSVIEEQVTNGVAVRMALLYLLLGGKSDEAVN